MMRMNNKRGIWKLISMIFMPQISSAYVFILLQLIVKANLLYVLIAILFSSLIQVLLLLFYARKSNWDINITNKSNRLLLFIAVNIVYLIGFIILAYLSAPFIMTALMLSYTINSFVAGIITKYWTKVSVHVWGISGPSIAILYIYGLIGFLVMLLLAAIIGYSRIVTGNHTIKQVLVAFGVSLPLTFLIIYYLAHFLSI